MAVGSQRIARTRQTAVCSSAPSLIWLSRLLSMPVSSRRFRHLPLHPLCSVPASRTPPSHLIPTPPAAAPAATWWSPSASATIYSISSRLAVQDDAIYNFSGSVALGPDYTVSVKVEEGELGLLGTAMGELDLDSPALLIGFDVQYEGDNVAYMDLEARREATDSTDSDLDGNAPYVKLHLICTVLLLPM